MLDGNCGRLSLFREQRNKVTAQRTQPHSLRPSLASPPRSHPHSVSLRTLPAATPRPSWRPCLFSKFDRPVSRSHRIVWQCGKLRSPSEAISSNSERGECGQPLAQLDHSCSRLLGAQQRTAVHTVRCFGMRCFDIDLDAAPDHRWTEVVEAYREPLRRMCELQQVMCDYVPVSGQRRSRKGAEPTNR